MNLLHYTFIESNEPPSLIKLLLLIGMINSRHTAIKAYLTTGQLPTDLPSTASNFKREASHYEIGSDGVLKREGKIVALYKDRKAIFDCYHATHSGNHLSCLTIGF